MSNEPIRIKANNETRQLTINESVKVVEIIKCRRGYIYKTDALLYPPWNVGPTLSDYIRTTPWLSITRTFYEKLGVFPQYEEAGPITALLVPDSLWTFNGDFPPTCVIDSLLRPENHHLVQSLGEWTTLPGLWNSTALSSVSRLPNILGPPLRVARVDEDSYPPGSIESPTILVEGVSVVKLDIPIYNGWVHLLAGLPQRQDLDFNMALWECVHDFCFQCPKLGDSILKFFDGGGLLPGKTPTDYIVPPGPRPSWVCQGSRTWHPPGWHKKEWEQYMHYAKQGKSAQASRKANEAAVKASYRLTKLEDELSAARIRLNRIKAYDDWQHMVSKAHRDPSHKISKILMKRDITWKGDNPDPDQVIYLPVCKGTDDKDQWKLTHEDLKYLARWMV
eukprot:Polyplicarium_translucidae@DN658_c0_g1_i1.p1